MNETLVTMVGTVAGEITRRRHGDDVPMVSFRLQVTERRYNDDHDRWDDGDQMFVSVHCWRKLADNAAACLARGDHVIVTGRLFLREYLSGEQHRLSVELDAHSVAPDLTLCTVSVERPEVQLI